MADLDAQLDSLKRQKRKHDLEDLQGGQDEGNEENEGPLGDGKKKKKTRVPAGTAVPAGDKPAGAARPQRGKGNH